MIMNPDHDNGIIGKSQNHISESKLQIISIMSVPPFKVTEPRRVCQVKVMSESTDDHNNINPIEGCYQTILYYENLNELEQVEEDHGWSLAGWIVESLSRALLEYPLLAGRLHRIIDVDGYDETGLQIVSNDSGVRFLEAWYSMRLSDFLELMNEKEHHHHLEDDLVSWKEIDVHCPQFSPLCYIQVTNFDCGGYSIGISCSLLLAEIFVVENFLNKWAQIHNNMLIQNQNNVKPVFCHTNKSKYSNGSLSSYIISCTKRKHRAQNMVFKLINYEDVSLTKESWREVAVLCIEEAEQKLDKNMGSDFCLVMKESTEVIMIECCSKSGCSNMQGLDLKNQVLDATWEDLGVNEVAFQEGNKPVHMSCWIESVVHGCVMVIPCKQQQGNAFVVIL